MIRRGARLMAQGKRLKDDGPFNFYESFLPGSTAGGDSGQAVSNSHRQMFIFSLFVFSFFRAFVIKNIAVNS
jgi:zona occludens toxin (predicted ATPase)